MGRPPKNDTSEKYKKNKNNYLENKKKKNKVIVDNVNATFTLLLNKPVEFEVELTLTEKNLKIALFESIMNLLNEQPKEVVKKKQA